MIDKLLNERYPLPEWVLIWELNKGTGFRGTEGRADAVAFNCYPSKKFVRHAFEIKTSRGDFIRELNNPLKRKWLEDNFHETYFVTANGIAKESEIPEGWGLLSITKKGDALRRMVIAKHREIPPIPESLALSAIRSLAQRLTRVDLPYILDGQEVTRDMVEKWANEILEHQHKTLRDRLNRVEKERLELHDLEVRLIEPFSILKEALGSFDWKERERFRSDPSKIITSENVREWLIQVANAQAKRLLNDAINARDSLTRMIENVHHRNST